MEAFWQQIWRAGSFNYAVAEAWSKAKCSGNFAYSNMHNNKALGICTENQNIHSIGPTLAEALEFISVEMGSIFDLLNLLL